MKNSLAAPAGVAALAVTVLSAAALAGTAQAHPATGTSAARSTAVPAVRVIAAGLDAPKYLKAGPGGLYVAESGTGGDHCVVGTANISVTKVCAGATGSIVRLAKGRTTTLFDHLPSATVASTHAVSGPTAIGFDGHRLALLMNDGGVGPTGASAVAAPYGEQLGKLYLASDADGGQLHAHADVAAFQATHPQPPATLGGLPGETLYDSDPHDMAAYRGGFAVADAGANDVVWIHTSGAVSVLARLGARAEPAPAGALGPGSPATTIQAQAVPSSVAVGPDGALYVGLLRGAPSLPGTAEVDRVVPGQAPQAIVTGLTRVSDLAFDGRGRLDILESSVAGGGVGGSATGALLRADVHGCAKVSATDLHVGHLDEPVGLAIGDDGTAYITNDTATPGKGEVVAVSGLD